MNETEQEILARLRVTIAEPHDLSNEELFLETELALKRMADRLERLLQGTGPKPTTLRAV